ncbi:YqeB family protein [Rhizomonospora bruguierae]|uniref:YqeB family protein n=1 Tax=Rhizomonospora bruguierae TaxID=1581705 RepID=UPI001BD07363|nr:hypothetical protein [Micromonospora sp. NBRC 107566]
MDAPRIVVSRPRWVTSLVWTVPPAAGAAAGWLLVRAAGWLLDLRWLPLRLVFRLIHAVPEPAATLGALALGGVAGLALSYAAHRDSLTVAVDWDVVATSRPGGEPNSRARRAVAAAFLDGKDLVLLGPDGAELTREACDLDAGPLAAAFTARGYPWRPDGDPFADAYRRWVPGEPALPVGADALFSARERAQRAGESADVAELRGELARLGVVVRDANRRQYWRLTGPAEPRAEPPATRPSSRP